MRRESALRIAVGRRSAKFFDSTLKYSGIAQNMITQTEKTLGTGDDGEPNQDMRLVTCERELPSLMECTRKAMQHCQEWLGNVDQVGQHSSDEVQTYFERMKPDIQLGSCSS